MTDGDIDPHENFDDGSADRRQCLGLAHSQTFTTALVTIVLLRRVEFGEDRCEKTLKLND